MIWMEETKERIVDDSDDSTSDGEEVPVWVRGDQRWVSGISSSTTCEDLVDVLLRDEENRGRHVSNKEHYHITERWRGVEQPLDADAKILDIWTAWGTAQPEVKFSLRRIKHDRPPSSRRTRCKSDSSTWSDRTAFKTIHPKRLNALHSEKQPSTTEELLKLVLAQGEVIRRQLKKLRNSEHQIGFLEDKTHKARLRKHGSNYLLETYLKGLPEAVEPIEGTVLDKNSDSGVMTEGDSEQSNKQSRDERFSPSSEEFGKDLKEDDTSSTVSEATIREQVELFDSISKLNKRLLKHEEQLVRLSANLKKYEKHKICSEELSQQLSLLRTEMTKSACEMQHNEVVLEETSEMLHGRRVFLENLHRDLMAEDEEHEMLQTLIFGMRRQNYPYQHTKELLDTLV